MLSSRLKIGAVNYINTLPLFLAIERGEVSCPHSFISGVPTELNRQLREGLLDASLVSSAEYLAKKDQYQMVPNICIGAQYEALSVLLYLRCPVAQLDGKQIAITPESATAAQLVRVMCRHYWKVAPRFSEMEGQLDEVTRSDQFDGFLLIGDLCLCNPHFSGYHTIDLAQAWYHATGLPFTFAVMAARKQVAAERPEEIISFQQSLHQSLTWAKQNKDHVVEAAQSRLSLSKERLHRYYEALQYTMDETHHKGLQLFEKLL